MLEQIVIGLANGSLFALIALGYTMVYGIVEIINFAHGEVFMLGAALVFTLLSALGPPANGLAAGGQVALLLLLVPAFCAAVNLAVYVAVYRPLRAAPRLVPLVSAIGASFVLMNLGLFWLGAADLSVPNLVPRASVAVAANLAIDLKDALVIAVVVPVMLGLTAFVQFTRFGKAMRAAAQDPLAAQLIGMHVDRIIAATFALGGGLAGVASVVYALYINTISYQMGFQNGLYAFTATVLGGIGNLPGAMLGGLLIGLARSLGGAYFGERWTSAAVFAMLIVLLVFRPQGLLGARVRERV